ncbi:hypothetical protein AAHA92_04170 [Salvia divinorum]|uniref:KIB1-4 beta-propeller domain-containing protein n=1 Tax=Salvia divinorum TaxID=28513 RepID=A0ABD1I1U3_SALDI
MASSILQSSIFCGMRMMSNTEPRKLSSPCLILPSSYEAGYKKLYSLAEKKVVSIDKAAPPPLWAQGGRVRHIGCSRGWVTSFDRDSGQAFLFDPITGCHIKLPDTATWPTDIILSSSSPDSHDCRAIIQYDHLCRVAVCSPARADAGWLPVCGEGPHSAIGYSARQNRLYSLNNTWDSDFVLECWDLEYPSSLVWKAEFHSFHGYEEAWGRHCLRYLVIDEHSDRLFLVIRVVVVWLEDEDDVREYEDEDEEGKYDEDEDETLRFHVYEIDSKKGEMRYMEGSLEGLAMFVGLRHSFALPAADLNLSPDSIYFTARLRYILFDDVRNDDIGIYNYKDGKISSIDYDPSQIYATTAASRVAPAMLLTPNIPH